MTAKNILIVDDEAQIGFTLKASLRSQGRDYMVSQVLSAEDALNALARTAYDLVVTDLQLPGLSGLDLISRIQHDAPQTQTILITAYGTDKVIEALHRLQVPYYFIKPFRVEEFLQAVDNVLSAAKIDQPLPAYSNFKWLEQHLHDLRFEIGAQVVLLADRSGGVVAESGFADGFDPSMLTSTLSRSLAPLTETPQSMTGEREFNLIYREGARFDVYAAGVENNLFLAVGFDRRQGLSRISMVWLYMKRTIVDLQTLIQAQDRSGTGL